MDKCIKEFVEYAKKCKKRRSNASGMLSNLKKVKASYDSKESKDEEMEMMMDSLVATMDHMFREMMNMEDFVMSSLGKHYKNHAPSPQTVSQMEAALRAFDMDKDYSVEKKNIFMD